MMNIDYSKTLPIQELSQVIQGEGQLMGVPHFLIRFTGCKLRCQFKDSFCDTWYASWKPEKGQFTPKQVEEFLDSNPNIKYVFITGGGPTLHKDYLPFVVNLCKRKGLWTTIETEGSEFVETKADVISLSPKLSNSTPQVGSKTPWGSVVTQKDKDLHEKWRTNVEAMKQLIFHQTSNNSTYQLKPVISSEEDLKEFEELRVQLGVPKNKCYLMPEGITDEQLQKSREWLFGVCIKEGYNYTDRLHVIVYGDKRGV
jgi:7-carboxy-7-deazaguanine synthase